MVHPVLAPVPRPRLVHEHLDGQPHRVQLGHETAALDRVQDVLRSRNLRDNLERSLARLLFLNGSVVVLGRF